MVVTSAVEGHILLSAFQRFRARHAGPELFDVSIFSGFFSAIL